MSNNENFISKHAIAFALVIVVIGIVIIIWFATSNPFNDGSFVPNSDLLAKYGSFIGGLAGTLFSLVASLLLYKTLITQQKAIEKQDIAINIQQSAFEKESFENTFFNLLKTQQELSTGIKSYFDYLNRDFSKGIYTIQGKEFFAYSKNELLYIWSSINSVSYLGMHQDDEESIYFLTEEIDKYYNPSSRFQSPPDIAEENEKVIRKNELLRYKNKIYNITENQWLEISSLPLDKKIEKTYSIFFQKYHYAIGHYFRHLYHLIKFAKEYKPKHVFDYNINKNYVNFIQAQMSSFEMMLLFYNSVSFPKLLSLLIEFNFLENLAEEDLISPSHNCIEGVKLKSRKDLLN